MYRSCSLRCRSKAFHSQYRVVQATQALLVKARTGRRPNRMLRVSETIGRPSTKDEAPPGSIGEGLNRLRDQILSALKSELYAWSGECVSTRLPRVCTSENIHAEAIQSQTLTKQYSDTPLQIWKSRKMP